jgi:histidine kinase/DNA gyrase B/HSP90-like ATPase
MKTNNNTESFIIAGYQYDIKECWKKIPNRQFKNPYKAGGELIQNAVDSYNPPIPYEERFIEVHSDKYGFSVTDYGNGMEEEDVSFLVTFAGSSKTDDSNKIGQFGIGFFSLFAKKLGTTNVTVTSKINDSYWDIIFLINHNDEVPEIKVEPSNNQAKFSTRVVLKFDNTRSSRKMVSFVRDYVKDFPCPVKINGELQNSIWENAKHTGATFFADGDIRGFITSDTAPRNITILCKYERIMTIGLGTLAATKRSYGYKHVPEYDLRDYVWHEVPYLPSVSITVNCNSLKVPISRDSFTLDSNYGQMIDVVARAIKTYLGRYLDSEERSFAFQKDWIIANQFILRQSIRAYLDKNDDEDDNSKDSIDAAIEWLANAKVYSLDGRREPVSLVQLKQMKSEDIPVFFSLSKRTINWLGGEYQADYVITPPLIRTGNGAPDFYDVLFESIFDDIVNLDTIKYDQKKILELVEKNIIEKKSLLPKCKSVGKRNLSQEEKLISDEIDMLLSHPSVKEAIYNNIYIKPNEIKAMFFEVDSDTRTVTIATGLFNASGDILFSSEDSLEEKDLDILKNESVVLLGIRRNHPLVESIVNSNNPHRAFYLITYLASQLCLCQKRLDPFSNYHSYVKEHLAADLRRVLLEILLKQKKAG